MITIKTIKDMKTEADRLRCAGKRIGLVPTMGFLHEGHLSLIRMAKLHTDSTVLSIFVNPLQFGPKEDFSKYPRDLARDQSMAIKEGVDILFCPPDEEMVLPGFCAFVHVETLTDILCGASRPGHFRGVTTIVAKLFHAVKPHVAVFGQKDAQQAVVIRRMVRDLNMDINVLVAPIVREPDGLAMSSRNFYLSPAERNDALVLSQSLKTAESMIQQGELNAAMIAGAVRGMIESKKSARIDYVAVVDPDTLKPIDRIESKALIAVAVFVGTTRLIDNMVVSVRQYELESKIRWK